MDRSPENHLMWEPSCRRRERGATYCNSMELSGMGSTRPHLKDLILPLMDARDDALTAVRELLPEIVSSRRYVPRKRFDGWLIETQFLLQQADIAASHRKLGAFATLDSRNHSSAEPPVEFIDKSQIHQSRSVDPEKAPVTQDLLERRQRIIDNVLPRIGGGISKAVF